MELLSKIRVAIMAHGTRLRSLELTLNSEKTAAIGAHALLDAIMRDVAAVPEDVLDTIGVLVSVLMKCISQRKDLMRVQCRAAEVLIAMLSPPAAKWLGETAVSILLNAKLCTVDGGETTQPINCLLLELERSFPAHSFSPLFSHVTHILNLLLMHCPEDDEVADMVVLTLLHQHKGLRTAFISALNEQHQQCEAMLTLARRLEQRLWINGYEMSCIQVQWLVAEILFFWQEAAHPFTSGVQDYAIESGYAKSQFIVPVLAARGVGGGDGPLNTSAAYYLPQFLVDCSDALEAKPSTSFQRDLTALKLLVGEVVDPSALAHMPRMECGAWVLHANDKSKLGNVVALGQTKHGIWNVKDGWVLVEWKDGDTNVYRYGYEHIYELILTSKPPLLDRLHWQMNRLLK